MLKQPAAARITGRQTICRRFLIGVVFAQGPKSLIDFSAQRTVELQTKRYWGDVELGSDDPRKSNSSSRPEVMTTGDATTSSFLARIAAKSAPGLGYMS